MSIPAKDRNKASRIRTKLRNGKATDSDRAWLASYESRRASNAQRVATSEPPAPRPSEPAARPADTENQPAAARPSGPALSPPPRTVRPGHVAVTFGPRETGADSGGETGAVSPPEARKVDVPAGTPCGIPNCPACAGLKGFQVCQATGHKVWPPMEETSARVYATMLLNGIGLAVRFMRKDKWSPQPTDREINDMTRGLQLVQARRFNAMSAVDDIMLVLGALAMYGTRAIREDPPEAKELPASIPVAIPSAERQRMEDEAAE